MPDVDAAKTGAGRLFRVYERHCLDPSPDTLFHLLDAMHSLNDRLQAAVGRDLHSIQEFLALKAIRNLAHHEEEVRANVRVIPNPSVSDLATLCVLRRDQVERAIEGVHKKWRVQSRAACEEKFHWYGPAVNINPCLFNMVVRTYQFLVEVGVRPPDKDVASFEDSYRYEDEQGHSHYVDGRLTTNIGQLSALFTKVVAEMPASAT